MYSHIFPVFLLLLQQALAQTMESPSTSPIPAPTTPPKQLFILSGQSNMAGRGALPAVPFEDPHHIFRLNAQLQWEVARDPLHGDIDTGKYGGVGPGMTFANQVKDHVGVIGLVPCAIGGTVISNWVRGQKLYENMLKRVRAAAEMEGGVENIRALLWFQGESDAASQYHVDHYKEHLEAMINNLREDLGLPSLPVIMVVIESGTELHYVDPIRDIQLGINLPNVVRVDSRGLELGSDALHLTTPAQVLLGKMLADAYLNNFGDRKC